MVADWLEKAQRFHADKNWIGAHSSVRNALRLDAKNLAAWRLASDIAMAQDKQHAAGRYAKGLKRFALKTGHKDDIAYADKRLAEVDQYFATQHLRWGETDLTHFAARGDVKKVRELLESGIDPNERNGTNWTALHSLRWGRSAAVAKLLVEHGANLEAVDTLKETPLITACRFGKKKLIPALIELGANVKHIAKEKHTALWYAIYSMKDVATIELLIQHGANPNEEYEYGQNAFLLAVYAQKPAVVNYLFPLVKDVGRMDKHQVCALSFSAGYNDTKLMKKLLKRGVPADQKNNYGHTALMSAVEKDNFEAAKLLMKHGADPHTKTKYGDSAASTAARRGNAKMYKLLTGEELDDSGGD